MFQDFVQLSLKSKKNGTKLQYELLFTFHSSKKQHGGQTCLVKFLFRLFKQEDIFYVLQDHQCIQALPLGLKMPMVLTQYNLERQQQKS